MDEEIVQIVVRSGIVEWLSAIGTLTAVLTAILLPFIRDRLRERKDSMAIKEKACFYLCVLLKKLEDINKKNGVSRTGEFEEENRKNFDALEFICLSSINLKPIERSRFIDLVTLFKTSDPIKQGEIHLVHTYLREIRNILRLFKKQ